MEVAPTLRYFESTGAAEFSVSRTGVLAYHGGPSTGQVVWVDRSNSATAVVEEPISAGRLSLSPDGSRLAVEVTDPDHGTRDIYIHDLTLGTSRRLTLAPSDDLAPVWWPDGSRLIYRSDVRGPPDIYSIAADGGGEAEPLVTLPGVQEPVAVNPRTGSLLFLQWDRTTGADLWLQPPDPGSEPVPYLRTPFDEMAARYSPDGRWLAFVSNETGEYGAYVAAADDGGTRQRVSTGAAFSPRWRGDGRELYFLAGGAVMAVPFDPDRGRVTAPARRVIDVPGRLWRSSWDVERGARRFVFSVVLRDPREEPITVLLSWPALLDRGRSGLD